MTTWLNLWINIEKLLKGKEIFMLDPQELFKLHTKTYTANTQIFISAIFNASNQSEVHTWSWWASHARNPHGSFWSSRAWYPRKPWDSGAGIQVCWGPRLTWNWNHHLFIQVYTGLYLFIPVIQVQMLMNQCLLQFGWASDTTLECIKNVQPSNVSSVKAGLCLVHYGGQANFSKSFEWLNEWVNGISEEAKEVGNSEIWLRQWRFGALHRICHLWAISHWVPATGGMGRDLVGSSHWA